VANITPGANVTIVQQCILTLTGLQNNSNVAVFDNTGTLVQSATASGTSFAFNAIQFTSALTYTYRVRLYGRQDVSGSFVLASGGVSIAVAQPTDAFITQSNSATVAAYSNISASYSPRRLTVGARMQPEIYDFLRYTDTLLANIGQAALVSTIDGINLTLNANLTLSGAPTGAGRLNLAAGNNVTINTAGTYTGLIIGISATGRVIVPNGTTAITNWDFISGALADNSSASAATVIVSADELSSVAAASPTQGGGSISIQAPTVNLSAANFADGVRVQVSRLESYTVTQSAINTTTDVIALTGNQFRSTGFPTLVRFTAASGATLPTSTPQIESGGLYYVVSVSGANVQLSKTQGGTALNFTAAGSGNFTFQGLTELDNSAVSGGAGYSIALSQANSTLLRVRARHWAAGAASRFFDQTYAWSATSGVTIPDTLSASATPDTIYNAIIAADYVVAPNGTQFSATNDGSAVTGLAVDADGVVEIDIDDPDGQLLIQDAYAWFVYTSSTQSGIRLISADNLIAEDLFNYVLSRIRLESVSAIPVQVVGGYIRSGDGSQLITTASNPLHLNAFEKGVAIAVSSGSSLTLQQIEESEVLAKESSVRTAIALSAASL